MSSAVRPYLVADDSSVGFTGWEIEMESDVWERLPDVVPEWDYNTALRLRTRIAADFARVRSDLGLHLDAPLQMTISWRSPDGRIGHRADSLPVEEAEGAPLFVVLPGDRLGPSVDLAARIVLARDLEAGAPGVAHLAGSVLWENVRNVLLVGQGERFPVMVVDFDHSKLDNDASWALNLPDELDSPVQGSLLLLINSRDKELVAAASGRRKSSERLIQDLHEQVAVQLLDHAVTHADELLENTWEAGSLGATLMLLAGRCEGGLEALTTLRERSSTTYRTTLVGEARRNGAGRILP